ncbi:hypothetical protein MYX06_02090 [Patescibacteria group bacterium AH-259-L05]|nr:hypothetical protein [Patescibacteria group bacterium AH-259-L05]
MRKRLKNKRYSCALCKPHKRGWDNRWKNKESIILKEFEKEKSSRLRLSILKKVYDSINYDTYETT